MHELTSMPVMDCISKLRISIMLFKSCVFSSGQETVYWDAYFEIAFDFDRPVAFQKTWGSLNVSPCILGSTRCSFPGA